MKEYLLPIGLVLLGVAIFLLSHLESFLLLLQPVLCRSKTV